MRHETIGKHSLKKEFHAKKTHLTFNGWNLVVKKTCRLMTVRGLHEACVTLDKRSF